MYYIETLPIISKVRTVEARKSKKYEGIKEKMAFTTIELQTFKTAFKMLNENKSSKFAR